jgi:membrane protein DedA with SNARE-associated domain
MFQSITNNLTNFLSAYGYLAVLAFVAIESTGIPFPGETMLIFASIYAGTTHRLSIFWVIAAAASGAILGDNIGYWVGREGGYRLLRRYGRYIRLDERKLKLGQYLFRKHGGKVVFFGRFIAVLRAWAAFLAGVNRMPWPDFLFFNAAGGITWATIYGLGAYYLGDNIHRFTGPVGYALLALGILSFIASIFLVRYNEERLEKEAEEAMPGPIDDYVSGRRDKKK